MNELHDLASFEKKRPYLLGLAYRILGSLADAEDAVQDTFIKWQGADRTAIVDPPAWLTTACTRRCIDILSARHTRVDYVGAWLPEPIHAVTEATPESDLELASSLSTAFLLLLERLTPKERAAYLLHEIFSRPYPEIAAALGMQEAACRKLVSRARTSVGEDRMRHVASRERQEELLAAFRSAVATGVTEPLAALLSDDIALTADGGGKVTTIERALSGKPEVLPFVAERLRNWWSSYEWQLVRINGALGALLLENGQIVAALSFAFDAEGRATGIFIMRNPDKLARLSAEVFLS